MRQKASNYALIYPNSFYSFLSTSSPPLINLKITPSISTTNHSPLSSERGWGWGFVFTTPFHLFLSTSSPPLINPKITTSISTTNYSPLSSERGWGRGFVFPIPPNKKDENSTFLTSFLHWISIISPIFETWIIHLFRKRWKRMEHCLQAALIAHVLEVHFNVYVLTPAWKTFWPWKDLLITGFGP